jgi:hypothetical protein
MNALLRSFAWAALASLTMLAPLAGFDCHAFEKQH